MGMEVDMVAIAKLGVAIKPAANAAIEALKSDVAAAQVMPFDTGDMQNNQSFTVTGEDSDEVNAHLITGSPQARRLYYHPEYNFQKVNNPNAGGEWLKPWIEGERKDFLQDTFAENYKKEVGM